MTNTFFSFGERLEGYSVPVLNERAVRAAAGIVFLFAIDPYALVAEPAVRSAVQAQLDPAEVERCKVPDFAKAMVTRKSGSCTTSASEPVTSRAAASEHLLATCS
jgi:hypothetical protein